MGDSQAFRGTIASIITTIIANTLNIIYMKYNKKKNDKFDPTLSTFLILFVFGNTLSYCLDILFAKKIFDEIEIPYDEFSTRFIWLLNSFFTIQFIKFILTIVLDMIIVNTIFDKLKILLNKYNINFYYRDGIVISILSLITFVTYVNLLRFHWAYVENIDPWMNMTMYAWIFLSVLIYISKLQV